MLARWFNNPEFLAVLAIVPVLSILGWFADRGRRRAIAELGNPNSIQAQILHGGHRQVRGLFWTLGLTLLALAAAGPHWGLGPAPPLMPGRDIVLVVDLSRSMLARDALPSRLGRAKEALGELIDAVKGRGGHRLGLVAFAGKAQIVCPLTRDYDHVRAKLAALEAEPLPPELQSTGVSGTRIGAGLVMAVDLLDPDSRGAQDIILVSDGDDPVGDDEWRDGYRSARAAGIPVHAVGIGDPERVSPIALNDVALAHNGVAATTRLQEAPLRDIASRTGGVYVSSGAAKPELVRLLRETISRAATRESIAGTLPQPVPRQGWFLTAGLVIVLLLLVPRLSMFRVLRRSRSMATAGVALILVSAASTPNKALRLGTDALEAGRNDDAIVHFAAAAERTTDPGLVAFNEGVALFRMRRYREAEIRFRSALSDAEGPRRARAFYNLGCALVQLSHGMRSAPLKDAIAAFEAALSSSDLDSESQGRARENLALTRRLLAQVPPERQSPPERPEVGGEREAPIAVGPESTEPGASGARVGQFARNGKPAAAGGKESSKTPGKGTLPPLPDEDAPAKLTPEDARAHLERAADRIAVARKEQLQRKTPAPSTQFPDW